MKQCPHCKKEYGDDMFFCLDDGNPLVGFAPEVDPNGPAAATIDMRQGNPTEVLPTAVPVTEVITQPKPSTPTVIVPRSDSGSPGAQTSAARRSTSAFAYVVIGALAATCVALAVALLFMNRDRVFGDQSSATQPANITTATPVTNRTSPSPVSNTLATASNQNVKTAPKLLSPVGRWKGEWSTDSGTLFDFDLRLTGSADKGLEGQIRWTMRKTVRPDKMNKVGLSASEFVRGTFDSDGNVKLNGYRKDDPDNVLVMLDEYRLKLSPDSKSLTGSARNGGKWNGHVSLSLMVAGE
jgi:hypothetical protein